jgi:ParB family chromosome partitioning protein
MGKKKETGEDIITYKEPISGKTLEFKILKIDEIDIHSYERSISEEHLRKLMTAISKVGVYLDPITVFKDKSGKYYVLNGQHRLLAMKKLGFEEIPAIIFDDPEIAKNIIALNTEKAPDIRDMAKESKTIYMEYVENFPDEPESVAGRYIEAYYVTCGFAYEKMERFGGSVFESLMKKVDLFTEERFADAVKMREERAERLITLYQKIIELEKQLKEQDIWHPFIRKEIFSHINPYKRLRVIPDTFDEVVDKLMTNLENLDVESFRAGLEESLK